MDNAVAVRIVERLAALERDLEHPVHRQQSVDGGVSLERPARDKFHDDVARVVLDGGIEDGNDMRVRQFPGQGRLRHEKLAVTPAVFLVAECFRIHDLDRDLAAGKGV